jgi:hypothetical protein
MIKSKDSFSIDQFLNLANDEFEALQNYANNFSRLSHVMESSQKSSLDTSESLLYHASPFMSSESQSNEELMNYMESLEDLRQSHFKLKHFVSSMNASFDPTAFQLFSDHIELSTRILQTCASSSCSKGFGPLHENGLLKNIRGDGRVDWHEVRVVSLTSLRASIERIKSYLD